MRARVGPRLAACAAAAGVLVSSLVACSEDGGAPESPAGTVAGEEQPGGVPAASPEDGGPGVPKVRRGGDQSSFLDRLPGSTDGGCVETAGQRDVRSGDLAAGPFDEAASQAAPVRLYVLPARSLDGAVRVVATDLETGETVTDRAARPAEVEEAEYFELSLDLPATGTWEVRATAGPLEGCWRLTRT